MCSVVRAAVVGAQMASLARVTAVTFTIGTQFSFFIRIYFILISATLTLVVSVLASFVH